jgi:DNA invertase Pin-like site-specific DNA recombinase
MASSNGRSGGIVTALIYTRVSTDEQAREGLSLDAQLNACRRYVADHGWQFGEEYQDVLTGSRDDRVRYQDLLADVRRLRAERRHAVVVVPRLDRFGRRLLERVRSREEFKALGVPLHSVREGGEVSDLMANMLAVVAQDEVERLSARVREVREEVAAKGWMPPGKTPWGYRWRPATTEERAAGAPQVVLEIDPETASYVREVFARFAAGAPVRAVCRWVASLPDAARGGRSLQHVVVRQILRAPLYAARHRGDDGGDVLADPPQRWPALIDDATWAEVQRRMDGHARMPRQATGRYLLTGLLRCPSCGARMCAWGPRVRAARYRCNETTGEGAARGRGCSLTILMEPVDAAVLAQVADLTGVATTRDAGLRDALRREWRRLQQPAGAADAEQRVRLLEREADKARQRLTKAAVMFADGDLDKAGYELLRDKARTDLEAADAELERLRGVKVIPTLPPLAEVLRAAGGWATALAGADGPARREVLAELVERVIPVRVARGRYDITITWTALGEALRALATAGTAAEPAA